MTATWAVRAEAGVLRHLGIVQAGGQDATARREKGVVGQKTFKGKRASPVKESLGE